MQKFDIAIAGAGPAGSVAATLLARRGARVALVVHPLQKQRYEGASPRVAALLGRLNLPNDALGPPLPRITRWNGLPSAPNREHLVDRLHFDSSLVEAARSAGAAIIEARAGRLSPGIDSAPGRMELSGQAAIEAAVLIEARGRQAHVEPGRRRGPPTVAIAGMVPGAADTEALGIEALDCGWRWTAALPGRGRWVQIVADVARIREEGLPAVWSRLAGPDAPLPNEPVVRAAELRLNMPDLAAGILPLGDAAVGLDPLSGQGIWWAISAALSAGPLVQALCDGEGALAKRFYRERMLSTFWRQARIGRDFHAMIDSDDPFWTDRAAWPDNEPAHGRASETVLRRRVIIADGRLRESAVLVTPHDPDGVAFVAGQPVARLIDRLGGQTLPDAADFARRILPETPPETAAIVFGWLAARGFERSPLPKGPATSQEVPI